MEDKRKVSPLWVYVHSSGTLPLAKLFGIKRKEIVIEKLGETEERISINGTLSVDFIYIGTATRIFAGKPCHRPSLFLHLLPNKLPYVHSCLPPFWPWQIPQTLPIFHINPKYMDHKKERHGNLLSLSRYSGSRIAI